MLNANSRALINEFCAQTTAAAGVPAGTMSFAITPPMETKLRQAIMQSHAFLAMISLLPVQQIKGQVIDVGSDALSTGRAATRFMVEMGQSGNEYELVKTDSGAYVTWETLTQWGNSGSKGEWLNRMKSAMATRFALDMLRVGWNGTSAAAVTDPVANPLGQDVNKGWVQVVKEKKPGQVLASADLDPTGTVADSYKNLDSLVQDLINTTIAPEHQEDDDLVAIIGSNLIASEQHRLLEAANVPTEHTAAQMLAKTVAGRKAYKLPFFPANRVLVTSPKNLQILTQEGTQLRTQKNDEEELRYKSNHIRMEGYAVGNLNKFACIENVTIA